MPRYFVRAKRMGVYVGISALQHGTGYHTRGAGRAGAGGGPKMTAASVALRDRIFVGGSEMARRMRALDWSTTDFGAPESWPDHLRLAVSLCLTSRYPIIVWWGPQLSVLYNDAYIPILGSVKHPRSLGRP